MLQSTSPKRLGKKEGSRWDAQISLGKENRIDFMGGLGTNEDGNKKDWVEGMERESTIEIIGRYSGWGRNLVQGKVPGIYKDPSLNS